MRRNRNLFIKKIIITIILFVVVMAVACGIITWTSVGIGNHSFIDLKHNFDEAVIALPDGTIVSGAVQSWTDYEDSDCVQIKIDGVVYLTHYHNATLIRYEGN